MDDLKLRFNALEALFDGLKPGETLPAEIWEKMGDLFYGVVSEKAVNKTALENGSQLSYVDKMITQLHQVDCSKLSSSEHAEHADALARAAMLQTILSKPARTRPKV